MNSGDAILDVAALCRHLTTAGLFDANTNPPLVSVTRWLELGENFIMGKLAENGYDPVQTDAEVLGILQQLNVLEAVIKVELTHTVVGDGTPNERFEAFMLQREEFLEIITSRALESLGATTTDTEPGSIAYATGTSRSDKQTLAEDDDNISHRFRRNQFKNPSTIPPTTADDLGLI